MRAQLCGAFHPSRTGQKPQHWRQFSGWNWDCQRIKRKKVYQQPTVRFCKTSLRKIKDRQCNCGVWQRPFTINLAPQTDAFTICWCTLDELSTSATHLSWVRLKKAIYAGTINVDPTMHLHILEQAQRCSITEVGVGNDFLLSSTVSCNQMATLRPKHQIVKRMEIANWYTEEEMSMASIHTVLDSSCKCLKQPDKNAAVYSAGTGILQ